MAIISRKGSQLVRKHREQKERKKVGAPGGARSLVICGGKLEDIADWYTKSINSEASLSPILL